MWRAVVGPFLVATLGSVVREWRRRQGRLGALNSRSGALGARGGSYLRARGQGRGGGRGWHKLAMGRDVSPGRSDSTSAPRSCRGS